MLLKKKEREREKRPRKQDNVTGANLMPTQAGASAVPLAIGDISKLPLSQYL